MTEEEKMLLGEMYSSKDKELKRFYFRTIKRINSNLFRIISAGNLEEMIHWKVSVFTMVVIVMENII